MENRKLKILLIILMISFFQFTSPKVQALNVDDVINTVQEGFDKLKIEFQKFFLPKTLNNNSGTNNSAQAPTDDSQNQSAIGKFFGKIETTAEKAMGQQTYNAESNKPGFYQDQAMLAQVNRVAQKLVPTCERRDIDYHFTILNTDEVNAFAAPGGYVFVTRGLMNSIKSDDELAGVLGHELGHINCKHGIRKAETSGLLTMLVATLGLSDTGKKMQKSAAFAAYFGNLKLSRTDEFQADAKAVEYSQKAGYNPDGLATFLGRINNDTSLSGVTKIFSTHPPTTERIQRIRQEEAGAANPYASAPAPGPGIYYSQADPTSAPQSSQSQAYSNPAASNITAQANPSLQALYDRYCQTNQAYQQAVSANASYDEIMAKFNIFQQAQKAYIAATGK
ncbi:MAG: M48 family metalloprotease [Candidatus Riflebacteria bacterium]|nr:M48 family metalloprotease [Candidatus Riflebacteria bacterium]